MSNVPRPPTLVNQSVPIRYAWVDPDRYANLVSRAPSQALLVAWLCRRTEYAYHTRAHRRAMRAGNEVLQWAKDGAETDHRAIAKAAYNRAYKKAMREASPVWVKWRGLDTILKEQGFRGNDKQLRARLLRDLEELEEDSILELEISGSVRVRLASEWFANRTLKIPLPYPLRSKNPFFFGALLYCAHRQWLTEYSRETFPTLEHMASRLGAVSYSLLDGRRSRLRNTLIRALKEVCAIEDKHTILVREIPQGWKIVNKHASAKEGSKEDRANASYEAFARRLRGYD